MRLTIAYSESVTTVVVTTLLTPLTNATVVFPNFNYYIVGQSFAHNFLELLAGGQMAQEI